MPRPISPAFLEQLEAAEDNLGVSLAKLCVEAKLPMLYVAAMLGVSRMTIHSWYRGGAIHETRKAKIERLMTFIIDDMQAGVLPKKSLHETKEYAEALANKAIPSTNKKSGVTVG